MKNIFTIIIALLMLARSVHAQPVIAGGFGTTGLGIINGTTYSKTGTLGSGGFAFVSASKDGGRFYSTSPTKKLLFIDVATSSFVDSINIDLRNLASSNETNTLFALNNRALVRINTSTKAVTDSVVLGAPWLLTERPGSKEVWVTDSGKIHVVDYTTSLVVTTFSVAPSPYDYAGVSFNPGGTMAFKSAATTKKIYKIDAVTKAVVASVNTAPAVPSASTVSHDGDKVFVTDAANMKVMIYKTSDLSLVDSITMNKAPMNIYTHPTRHEIWVVHHFNDSISVYDENSKALIASFGCSGSPWYIAFGVGATKVNGFSAQAYNIKIYPNPANDYVTIDGLSKGDIVKIYDISAKLLRSWAADNNIHRANVSDLRAGLYLLQVLDNQGNIKTNRQVVKQ